MDLLTKFKLEDRMNAIYELWFKMSIATRGEEIDNLNIRYEEAKVQKMEEFNIVACS